MQENKLFFGCVADDFTGAADGASFLVKSGISTALYNGIPKNNLKDKNVQGTVIALKTRNVKKEQAVAESLKAFAWLKEQGARIFYFKYCSTFDSTEEGNIGPVIDAVMEKTGFSYTVLCPSLPVNGRTLTEGRLYVNGKLLEESHMKNHPLTPMKKSRLGDLMKSQGKYCCIETRTPLTEKAKKEISREIDKNAHCYVVPDYETDVQGQQIAKDFPGIGFYTGGSGLMEHLGKYFGRTYGFEMEKAEEVPVKGPTLLMAGSCSKITLEQIAEYQKKGLPYYKVIPARLADGSLDAEGIWREAQIGQASEILIYSSTSPGEVKKNQEMGKETIARKIEDTMADLITIARKNGIRKYVIAGGETSGAAMKALGFEGYHIGNSIAPGIPIMTPLDGPAYRLVLKSGNFGQRDFFFRAIQMLKGEEI